LPPGLKSSRQDLFFFSNVYVYYLADISTAGQWHWYHWYPGTYYHHCRYWLKMLLFVLDMERLHWQC